MKKTLIIFNFACYFLITQILVISTVFGNNKDNFFFLEVNSISLHESHTEYYDIYDHNFPSAKKNIKKIIGLEHPYFPSILPLTERSLSDSGYTKITKAFMNKDNINNNSLFPIVVSVGYFYAENPKSFNSSLVLRIEADLFLFQIKNHTNQHLEDMINI